MTIHTTTTTSIVATLQRILLGAAVIAGAVAATGCASASGPAFQGVAGAPAGNGQVYLYRKPGPIGNTSGTSYKVTLNKKDAGELYLGSFMHFVLPVGTHVFTVKPQALSKTYEQSVTVAENQTQFFEFEDPAFLLTNAFSLGSNITPRTADQAKAALKDLKAVK